MSEKRTGTGCSYASVEDELYAGIRREAFGEEIGQFSWLTADEYRTFFTWLGLGPSSHVLEVACGSGGPALFTAQETGCSVTGLDIHEAGVAAASERARRGARPCGSRGFVCVDARRALPFADASFDGLTCIDAWNHLYEREQVLAEWHLVLSPGGRALFTDPITVTGMIRREEMVVRSGSMGEFVFTPPGVDERLMRTPASSTCAASTRPRTCRSSPRAGGPRARVTGTSSIATRVRRRTRPSSTSSRSSTGWPASVGSRGRSTSRRSPETSSVA